MLECFQKKLVVLVRKNVWDIVLLMIAFYNGVMIFGECVCYGVLVKPEWSEDCVSREAARLEEAAEF